MWQVIRILPLVAAVLGTAASCSREPDARPAGSMAETVSDSLRVTLAAPDAVSSGTAVPLTLRVENTSGRPLELHLLGRSIVFDLVVTREDGSGVWRRLAGESVSMILRLEPLATGASLEFRDAWSGIDQQGRPVSPGTYLAYGELLTEHEPLRSATARVTITSGR